MSEPAHYANAYGTYVLAERAKAPLILQSGAILSSATLAYETYGTLDANGSNAILLFHALSGSQHAAGIRTDNLDAGEYWQPECHLGWWDNFIGPGKALDTDRDFIICANFLGGCYGSSGPATIDPAHARRYGEAFPVITANDIVDTQVRLLAHLKVNQLHAVVGASLGGLFAMNLACRYPEFVSRVISIASGIRTGVLQRIHNFEQILAIENDPKFKRGDYYDTGEFPENGLMLARMIAHKDYVSLEVIEQRARREVLPLGNEVLHYTPSNQIESYMLHQGRKFVRRFDANSYLRILGAWQHYDLLRDAQANDWGALFSRCHAQRHLVFSIDSDVCFWPEHQELLCREVKPHVSALRHLTVHSDKGHDSFLLETELFQPQISHFLSEG